MSSKFYTSVGVWKCCVQGIVRNVGVLHGHPNLEAQCLLAPAFLSSEFKSMRPCAHGPHRPMSLMCHMGPWIPWAPWAHGPGPGPWPTGRAGDGRASGGQRAAGRWAASGQRAGSRRRAGGEQAAGGRRADSRLRAGRRQQYVFSSLWAHCKTHQSAGKYLANVTPGVRIVRGCFH